MGEILYFEAEAESDEILKALKENGACVILNLMKDGLKDRVLDELKPLIESTPDGNDDFTGKQTGRTGALVARSESSRELVMDRKITALATQFLEPYTDKIQLHLTQIIDIRPGQGAQPRHRDRLASVSYTHLTLPTNREV